MPSWTEVRTSVSSVRDGTRRGAAATTPSSAPKRRGSGGGPGDPARAPGRADPRRPAAGCHPRSHRCGPAGRTLADQPHAGDGSRSGDRGIRSFVRLGGRRVEFVAISNAQRHLAPRLPWAGRVYNGITTAEWPYRSDKDDYVLFLGRLAEDKGLHVAIDASRAAGMRLVVAGGARGAGRSATWRSRYARGWARTSSWSARRRTR